MLNSSRLESEAAFVIVRRLAGGLAQHVEEGRDDVERLAAVTILAGLVKSPAANFVQADSIFPGWRAGVVEDDHPYRMAVAPEMLVVLLDRLAYFAQHVGGNNKK